MKRGSVMLGAAKHLLFLVEDEQSRSFSRDCGIRMKSSEGFFINL